MVKRLQPIRFSERKRDQIRGNVERIEVGSVLSLESHQSERFVCDADEVLSFVSRGQTRTGRKTSTNDIQY